MPTMPWLWPALFILSLFLFWTLTLVGLPGNWLILLACIAYAALYAGGSAAMMGWGTVAAIAVLLIIAEALEFMGGAAGVAKGGSKRGAIFAMIGSIVGSLIGASVGSIVPVLGTVVGIFFGACAGAMVGAVIGERSLGKSDNVQWEVGKAAFWGRFWGTLAKLIAGAIAIGVALVSVIW